MDGKKPKETDADPQDAPGIDRRTWLKQVGAVAATAVLGAGATGCDDDGGAQTAAADTGAGPDVSADMGADLGADLGADSGQGDAGPGPFPSLQPVRGDGSHPYHYIDTLVIVQMENRSFDHYFGALSLLEGRTEIDGLTADIINPRVDGSPVGIEALGDHFVIEPDPSHGHSASLQQFSGGTCQGFVQNWENKLSAEEMAEKLGWVMGYHTREELPAIYTLSDHFTVCDRWFCSLLGPTWPNRFYSHAATSDGNWSNGRPIESTTPYRYALDSGVTVGSYHESPIYFMGLFLDPSPRDFDRNASMTGFFLDAAAGALPNISVVEPDYSLDDDHPPHDVRLGQAFIQSIYEALRQSPQWERTLMIVFYDEHGGFHDHVAPPLAEGDERAAEGFDQLGFRVPGLVISPLAKEKGVFSEVVDHASVPALISDIFELPHVNERSRLAGGFSGAFDLELTLNSARPTPPVLPPIEFNLENIQRGIGRPCGQPELEQFMRQRYGITLGTNADKLRRFDTYAAQLEALKVARFR